MNSSTESPVFEYSPEELNCTEAVMQLVLQPNNGHHFFVDWARYCGTFTEPGQLGNQTYWSPRLSAEITLENPRPSAAVFNFARAMQIQVMFSVCLVGILANLLVMLVLALDKKKTGTIYLMIALAAADELLVVGMFVVPARLTAGNLQPPSMALIEFMVVLQKTAQVMSVWMVVCLTVERFIVVCFPLRARVVCTRRNTLYVIAVVFVVCILYRIPLYGSIRMANKEVDLPNYTIGYEVIADGMIVFVIPMLALFILNALLIVSIFMANKRRKKMTQMPTASGGRNKGKSTSALSIPLTLNVIAIVTLFLICQSLIFVFFLGFVDRYYFRYRFFQPSTAPVRFRFIIGPVSQVSLALNSTLNIFIYFLFYPKFRARFRATFCPCVKSGEGGGVSSQLPLSGGSNQQKAAGSRPVSSGSGSLSSKKTTSSILSHATVRDSGRKQETSQRV